MLKVTTAARGVEFVNQRDRRQLHRLGVEEVPTGWELRKVGNSCSVRNDLRLPLSVEVRNSMQGRYPYYGPTGVLDMIDEYRLEGDYTLIGEDGDHFLEPTSKAQTVRVSGQFNVNNHAHVIAGTHICSIEWFFYFFQHRDISHSLTRQGAGRFKLTKASLEDLPILIPPRPEQQKIAEILGTWDEAIEKLIALRVAKNTRLSGLQDRLIAESCNHGSSTTFGSFLSESRVPGTDGSSARKISVKLYGKGAVERSETRTGSSNTQYYRRSSGQLIYSKLDFLNGAFALIGDELDGLETTLDLPAFNCDPAVNERWLLYYLTRSAYYSSQVHLARGQRKARRISPADWLSSPIRLPDRKEQDRIVGILEIATKDLRATEELVDAVQRQKRGLMQKLLTGEWRVDATTEMEARE